MKSLSDILRETGISYRTLVKYKEMGFVPKPQILRHGRKGTESLYPDNVIDTIKQIEALKLKHTLAEIREQREESGELVAAKPNPDYLSWGLNLSDQLDKRFPGGTVSHAEFVEAEKQPNGSVVVHYKAKIVPKHPTNNIKGGDKPQRKERK